MDVESKRMPRNMISASKSVTVPTLDWISPMILASSRYESMERLLGELLQTSVRGIRDRGRLLNCPKRVLRVNWEVVEKRNRNRGDVRDLGRVMAM